MNNPTEYPPCALLFTGEVLKTWFPPELYDPATGSWRPTGNFVQTERGYPGHSDHSLVVLVDGRALALGSRDGSIPVMGEMYDPVSEQWSLTASSDLPRSQ